MVNEWMAWTAKGCEMIEGEDGRHEPLVIGEGPSVSQSVILRHCATSTPSSFLPPNHLLSILITVDQLHDQTSIHIHAGGLLFPYSLILIWFFRLPLTLLSSRPPVSYRG